MALKKPTASRLAEDVPPPPFEGFEPAALNFFRGLAENQNKAWFDANKHIYEAEVKAPLASLVVEVTAKLAKKSLALCADPRRAIFRINRDVRFSNDKSPYKTHAGAAITRTGAKNSPGLLYLHVAPDECFTAAGFYHPEPETLAQMRQSLIHHPERWQAMRKALKKHGLELSREETLARPPKGYDPIPEAVAEDIKLKNWVTSRPLTPSQLANPKLVDEVVEFALAAAPLLKFGWAVITP